MVLRPGLLRSVLAATFIAAVALSPLPLAAQDLVAVNSISGASSVFVFRTAARVKRFVAQVRPVRTKVQRIASATKIKRQYETLAKVKPRQDRAKPVDPASPVKTIGPVEGSKRLAGIGEYYLERGELPNAILRFREATELDPKNINAKNGLSEVLARTGNELLIAEKAAEAKPFFLEALTFNPKNAAAYFGLGEVYGELDQFTEAIANYERSLAEDKDLTEIYLPLGILYYQTGEIAKADDLLTKAAGLTPDSAETQLYLGLVRSSQNRMDEAAAAFAKAKSLDPSLADAFYHSGESLTKAKRFADAVPDYQKAVDLKPQYFDAWLGLAEAQYGAGKYAESIAAYAKAAELKNDNWELFAGWADAYIKAGKYADAAARGNLAVTFLTRMPEHDKNVLADLYSKTGFAFGAQCEQDMAAFRPCQWAAAVRNLEKAVAITNDPIDHANLGWAYFNWSRVDLADRKKAEQQDKLAKAKASLEKAMAGNDKVREGASQNLANVLIDSGDFAGAVNVLKVIIEKDPTATFPKYAMASAYGMMGDNDNAAKFYREVIDKEPNFVSAIRNLGIVEVKRKNGKEAKKLAERLKGLSPADYLYLNDQIKKAKL